ncbi:MAG: hypothetical protein K2X90_04425 [Candidatus Babeliaceae bacterium]|nr:hypothetical protein [Candidatus Babeliaceae bacterium]
MNIKKTLFFVGIGLTFSLQALRLRFIVINNTQANLFTCLRTHDCNPLSQAEMRPGEAANIYTESFKTGITRFILKLETNNKETNYDVVYNSQTKQLQLQRNGITIEEISYTFNSDPENTPVIRVDKWLDAHFDAEAIYNERKVTGMNAPNARGYTPGLAYGNNGYIEIREDRNRFCPKKSECRYNLARLSSYLGLCNNAQQHDNLNPFCRKTQINWQEKRFKKC